MFFGHRVSADVPPPDGLLMTTSLTFYFFQRYFPRLDWFLIVHLQRILNDISNHAKLQLEFTTGSFVF